MTSRSQKQKRPSFRARAHISAADGEMRVARGMADAARTPSGHGALGLNNKDKLKLGKKAAKTMLSATMKKNRAKQGK